MPNLQFQNSSTWWSSETHFHVSQTIVCLQSSKFSSRSDLAEHKRLSHLDYPVENDEGRVYSCQKCGSRFDNAKIFAVHVKVLVWKVTLSNKRVKRPTFSHTMPQQWWTEQDSKNLAKGLKRKKKFHDSIQFHQLPKSQGFFENNYKRTTMQSAFIGNQVLNLKSTKNIKKENRVEDREDIYIQTAPVVDF